LARQNFDPFLFSPRYIRTGSPRTPRCKGYEPGSHSDRHSQYLSIKYTKRLEEAGIQPAVCSVGDSNDNALAERISGLFKTKIVHRRGPWRSFEPVEYATLEWAEAVWKHAFMVYFRR
jgi:transposase InsO family protein